MVAVSLLDGVFHPATPLTVSLLDGEFHPATPLTGTSAGHGFHNGANTRGVRLYFAAQYPQGTRDLSHETGVKV